MDILEIASELKIPRLRAKGLADNLANRKLVNIKSSAGGYVVELTHLGKSQLK